ncbi:MAG: hypothetical protein U0183_14155 [Polyangiaceae bacterium]
MVGEDDISVPWPDRLWDSARSDMCVMSTVRPGAGGVCIPVHAKYEPRPRYIDRRCTQPAVKEKEGVAVVRSGCLGRAFEPEPGALPLVTRTYTRDDSDRCVPAEGGGEVWLAKRELPRLSTSDVAGVGRLRARRLVGNDGLRTELPGALAGAFDGYAGRACTLGADGYCRFEGGQISRVAGCPGLGASPSPPPLDCGETPRFGNVLPAKGPDLGPGHATCEPSYVRIVQEHTSGGDACVERMRENGEHVYAVEPFVAGRAGLGERTSVTGRLRVIDYVADDGTPLTVAHYYDAAQDMPCQIKENPWSPGTYACYPPIVSGRITYVDSACGGAPSVLVAAATLASGPQACPQLTPLRRFVTTTENGLGIGEVVESKVVSRSELPPLYERRGTECRPAFVESTELLFVTKTRAVRAVPLVPQVVGD